MFPCAPVFGYTKAVSVVYVSTDVGLRYLATDRYACCEVTDWKQCCSFKPVELVVSIRVTSCRQTVSLWVVEAQSCPDDVTMCRNSIGGSLDGVEIPLE